jgi:ketosteroid isomerase-like protein
MSADQNIETIKSIYEAFGLGDVEAILANVTNDVPRRARAHRDQESVVLPESPAADGRARCETLRNAVSQDNVELVRRLYRELASEGSTQEFEQRMSDDALGRFLDPEIEWVPVTESLLAVDSYRGFDGVRRFWGEFLSAWERYRVETLRFDDASDQVAVVVHIVGRTHELEVDETRSSLLTVRDGRIVRVESFANPDGARQAAGVPP